MGTRAILSAIFVALLLSVSGGAVAQNQAGDQAVRSQILSELKAQPSLRGERIHVGVRDGVVTLNGEISGPVVWNRVGDLARNTDGVQRVRNYLRID